MSNRHVAWRLRPRALVACGIPVSLRPRSFPEFGASSWRGRCFGLALKRKAEVAHPLSNTPTPPPRMACLFDAWLSLINIRQPETAGLVFIF